MLAKQLHWKKKAKQTHKAGGGRAGIESFGRKKGGERKRERKKERKNESTIKREKEGKKESTQ